ncbi:MAG: diguanylate cyclase [Thermotogae bacterium]|nr:diguanylate cyclase [Thermotogota bacterium]
MGVKVLDELEKLKMRVQQLEDELQMCKQRERELEGLLDQYTELLKQELKSYDDFVGDIGTSKMIDPLTRVFNKDYFLKFLTYFHQRAFEESIPYGVVLVKIKNYDELERAVGDGDKWRTFSMQFGKSLKESVRVPLDTVGRLSKDTFAVILTEIDKDVMDKVVERIKNRLESLDLGFGTPDIKMVHVHYPEDAINLEALLSSVGEEL